MDRALITGGAGFIGSHLAQNLLESSWDVTIVDNFDPFYSKATKLANILAERKSSRFHVIEADIRDYESLRQAQGSMGLLRCPDVEAFERGNYLRALQTWRR